MRVVLRRATQYSFAELYAELYAVLLRRVAMRSYAVLRSAMLGYAVLLRSATKSDVELQREAAMQGYALPCCATQAPLTVAKQCCCAEL